MTTVLRREGIQLDAMSFDALVLSMWPWGEGCEVATAAEEVMNFTLSPLAG